MGKNKVYLNAMGRLFIDGHEIMNVKEVSTKTDFMGTSVIIRFSADYENHFKGNEKEHSIYECPKE